MATYVIDARNPRSEPMDETKRLIGIPVTVSLPKCGTEEEHVKEVEFQVEMYSKYGVEPLSVHRNVHHDIDGRKHETTEIFYGNREPVEAPRDLAEEVRWAEDAINRAQLDLKDARQRLRDAKARLERNAA